MNLYKEARAIAQQAYDESKEYNSDAQELVWEMCDMHAWVVYYHKAMMLCAENDTSEGEEWLGDCGGIAQPGDSFGQIACRVAFATLYCKALQELSEIEMELKE